MSLCLQHYPNFYQKFLVMWSRKFPSVSQDCPKFSAMIMTSYSPHTKLHLLSRSFRVHLFHGINNHPLSSARRRGSLSLWKLKKKRSVTRNSTKSYTNTVTVRLCWLCSHTSTRLPPRKENTHKHVCFLCFYKG